MTWAEPDDYPDYVGAGPLTPEDRARLAEIRALGAMLTNEEAWLLALVERMEGRAE
jgi:hypothetical protein